MALSKHLSTKVIRTVYEVSFDGKDLLKSIVRDLNGVPPEARLTDLAEDNGHYKMFFEQEQQQAFPFSERVDPHWKDIPLFRDENS